MQKQKKNTISNMSNLQVACKRKKTHTQLASVDQKGPRGKKEKKNVNHTHVRLKMA